MAADQQLAHAQRALETFLAPDQVCELRIKVGPEKMVSGGFFRSAQELAQRALQAEREGAHGCYFTPNPLRPDLVGAKGSARKADVARRRWLLLDVDPVRPTEHLKDSSTERERQAAWDVLGLVRGTLEGAGLTGAVVGHSGNGWHVCYPIDLPNDDVSQEQVKAVLVGLSKRCNTEAAQVDTKVFDSVRIWKLYGTITRKGKPTIDRPHRYARLIDGQPWDEGRAQRNNALLPRLLQMWGWIDETRKGRPAGDLVGRATAYIAKIPGAVSGQGGSAVCYHTAAALVEGFGLDREQAFQVLQPWNATCRPPWSEKELYHKIDSAIAKRDPAKVGSLATVDGEQPVNGYPSANGHSANGVAPLAAPIDPNDIATVHDLIRAGAEVRWLWPGWIQRGVLNVLAAEGGTGKTRLCADLMRRIATPDALWPDGTVIDRELIPLDSKSLWVLSDNHHDEMVTLARNFGIIEAIRLNAPKNSPYEGVTLDEPADLIQLEARIRAVKPCMVLIDTVGNSTDKNLSKQEDAKAFYQPLQLIARRTSCALICLTHLSAGGQVLGRRAREKVRIVIQLESPEGTTGRRRLWVDKSNAKYPAPLGVTMQDGSNLYDQDPPARADQPGVKKAKGDSRAEECGKIILDVLKRGPSRIHVLRNLVEGKGFSSKTFYDALKLVGAEQFTAETKQWVKLTTED